jgi:hypothetical protein
MTRQRLILAVAALLALVGSFGVGRYSRAPSVVTKDVVRVEIRDVIKTQVVHDVQTVHDTETKLRTVTRWQTTPGGVTTVVQEVARDTQAETKRADHIDAKQDRETQQTSVTVHTVDARPTWSVSLMPGAQLAGARAVDLYGPLVLGVAIERRILGPVWLGAWGSTSGAAGLSLRGEF